MKFKKTVIGAAVTSTSRATTGTITIPGKKGGVVTAVEVQVFPTVTTVVNSGGLVELENSSVDWKPFEFYTHIATGAGANVSVGQMKPFRLEVRKPLPENSTITVYYTPLHTQSQKLAVTVEWDISLSWSASMTQTFIKSGVGSALTQTTIASAHVTINIPAAKGGKALAVMVQHSPTIETVVDSGGLVALRCDSMDPTPFDFYTSSVTTIGTGGATLQPDIKEADFEVLGNANYYFDYTPQDNQSQFLMGMIVWEGHA